MTFDVRGRGVSSSSHTIQVPIAAPNGRGPRGRFRHRFISRCQWAAPLVRGSVEADRQPVVHFRDPHGTPRRALRIRTLGP